MGSQDSSQEHVSSQKDAEQESELQFVLVTDPQLPPGEKHKRAVRSHIMRTFHSRRRKQQSLAAEQLNSQKGAKNPPIKTPAAHAFRTIQAKDQNSASQSSRDPSSEGSHNIISPTQPYDDSPGEPSHTLHRHAGLNEETAPYDRAATKRTIRLDCDGIATSRDFLSHFDRWLFQTTTPYALIQTDGAPFMLLQCKNWPFPQRVGRLNPKISVWMPESLIPAPNLRLPRSCMHVCSRVLPYIHNSFEYYTFKIETIRWINLQLQNCESAFNDATLGSIMLLTDLELGRGNIFEAVNHMNGIQRIVNLRGGIDASVYSKQIQIKISILDLVSAVMSSKYPRFTIHHSPLPRPLLTMIGTNIIKILDSPLYGQEPLETILQGSEFCSEAISILHRMRVLTNLALDPRFKAGMLTLTSPEETTTSTPYIPTDGHSAPSLLRIIYLTSVNYQRALLMPPIPFASPVNKSTMEELCRALESPSHDATWDHYPGILVWCLLTGAAATQNGMPEHGLLTSLLIKVALGAGYGWWEEIGETMITFLRIKMRAEGLKGWC